MTKQPFPSLNDISTPLTKTGNITPKTLETLRDEYQKALRVVTRYKYNKRYSENDKGNALKALGMDEDTFEHFCERPISRQVDWREPGSQYWPWLGFSSENVGAGCCGIKTIMCFGHLIPKHREEDIGPYGIPEPGSSIDFQRFRWAVADFMLTLQCNLDSETNTGKMYLVTLTHRQANKYPHLIDILDYFGFELTCEHRNSSTSNQILTFILVKDAVLSSAQSPKTVKIKNMRKRALARISKVAK